MSTQKTLKVEGLRKQYGKKYAVRHVDFEMRQGEVVGLLGPNGAGKTTTFYMITGLIHPTPMNSPEVMLLKLKINQQHKKGNGGAADTKDGVGAFDEKLTVLIKKATSNVEGATVSTGLFTLKLRLFNSEPVEVIARELKKHMYAGAQMAHNKESIGELFDEIGRIDDSSQLRTILIRIISLLTESKIYLDGENITNLPMYQRARRGIGYLAQEASVFRKMTVEQNLLAILETMDLTREQMIARKNELINDFFRDKIKKERERQLKDAEQIADMEKREARKAEARAMEGYLLIEPFIKQKAFSLSGGERRRAEIARAICVRPAFLLLDEPFAGIDPIAVMDIQDIIKQLRERGLGILITDHNVRETLKITDRSYIMYDGSILISGTVEELLNNEQARKVYLGEDFKM